MLTTINAGDTAWMLVCTALVFLMIPGLALFYSGLFRKNSSQAIWSLSFTLLCFVTLQWVLFGYSLSFGSDHNGWIGTLAQAALRGVTSEPNMEYVGTVPALAFMMFRGLSAVLAAVIFLGPFAERCRGKMACLVALFWTTLVCDPVMHWMWGVGGFLRVSGVLDFAGSATLFLTAGMSALAMTFVVKNADEESFTRALFQPELAWLGIALFWMGGFGLIAGSARTSFDIAVNAFVMTQIAAVTAAMVWMLLDKLLNQTLSPLGFMTGAVAGIIAASASSGYLTLWGALGTGIGAAVLSYVVLAVATKKFGPRDSNYVISLFGVGGLWGMLAAGLWATKSVTSGQFLIQVRAILAISLYSFGATYLFSRLLWTLIAS